MQVIEIDSALTAKAALSRPEPELTLVPKSPAGEQALRLFLDARTASLDHLGALQDAIGTARGLAEGVVKGGELYTVGLNDFAKRLRDDLFWRAKTLESLAERQRQAALGR
jgi:hypothetical protein